jgi:hypothetical protein
VSERIGDEEVLFRSVEGDPAKGQWARDEDNVLRVSSQAFMDPTYRPSVDRAALCSNDPLWTRRKPGDGVVRLSAASIRAISPQEVGDRDSKGHVSQERRVDAVPDRIDADAATQRTANPAHALIVTTPQIATSNKAWSRVRAALAFVANQHGWALEPAPQRLVEQA